MKILEPKVAFTDTRQATFFLTVFVLCFCTHTTRKPKYIYLHSKRCRMVSCGLSVNSFKAAVSKWN